MFRSKLLVGAIAAAATMGMSGVALANGGSYEPDYSTPAPMSSDGGAGLYLGVQGGYALTHWKNIAGKAIRVPDTVNKDDGFAGRAFAGYAFNKYIALEGGWTYLPSSIKASDRSDALKSKTSIDNWAADGSFVLSVPVIQQFGLYTTVGLGYFSSKGAVKLAHSSHSNTIRKANMASWNVTFGGGAYYDITSRIKATLGWRRYE